MQVAGSPQLGNTNSQTSACTRRQALLGSTVLLSTHLCPHASHAQVPSTPEPTAMPGPSSSGQMRLVTAGALQQDYDTYADSYDDLDGGAAAQALGFPELRQQLLQQARGTVLEVGIGTGLNLPFYDWKQVQQLTGVDLSQGMLSQAQLKAASIQRQQGLPQGSVQLVQGDVASLPLPDAAFDTVVDTFSLCVFPDPVAALKELLRVVKPTGQVLLLEHNRSSNPLLGWYQDLTADAVAATGKGCYWNQNVPRLLADAGLKVVDERPQLGGLLTMIVAQKA